MCARDLLAIHMLHVLGRSHATPVTRHSRHTLPPVPSSLPGPVLPPIPADSITLMQKPSAERVPLFVIWSFCLSNILLTGLQFFWGSLILRGIAKVLQGKPADDDKED